MVLEPVFPVGRAQDMSLEPVNPELFIEKYREALKIARKMIVATIGNIAKNLVLAEVRYCP